MKKHVDLEACRTYIRFWIKVLLRCQCRWQVLVSSLYTECSNGDGVSFSRLALMELWVSYLYTGWRCSHHACGVIQGKFSSKSPSSKFLHGNEFSICSIKRLHLHWCKCCMFHCAQKKDGNPTLPAVSAISLLINDFSLGSSIICLLWRPWPWEWKTEHGEMFSELGNL